VIRRFHRPFVLILLTIALVVVPVVTSMAGTSAASYHWARKQSQFTLKVGDNVSDNWNRLLRRTLADWNRNDTVTLDKVGGRANPKDCRPNKGRVEVCNWPYGTQKGWLGLTQLFFDRGGHIEAATVQMNDSFLNAPNSHYNSDAARIHTLCHELGHATGLEGHENNRSCMNNSQHAVFNYLKPIRSDFRELARIYGHRDRETTVSSASLTSEGFVVPTSLPAKPRGPNATETVTVQTLEDGQKVVTFIIWAKD
jgi:hypothetical protein